MAKFSDIFGGFRKEPAKAASDYQEYLLGGLSSARRTVIEQNSIFDDQVSDALLAAEEALLQGYSEGSLTPDVRERFEALISSSTEWRQKIKLAKALSSLLLKQNSTIVDPPFGPSEPFPPTAPGEFTRLFARQTAAPSLLPQSIEGVRDELTKVARQYLEAEKGLAIDDLYNEVPVFLSPHPPSVEKNDPQIFKISMAKTIRRILVDRAKLLRARGTAENSEFEQNILSIEAACADLEAVDPRANRVFELVFFGGLSIDATAEILGVSSRTAKRDWLMARAFLASTISRNKQ